MIIAVCGAHMKGLPLNRELLALNGRYRQLYDKQYRFEKDRFINPGEDFTPEPEPLVAKTPRASARL